MFLFVINKKSSNFSTDQFTSGFWSHTDKMKQRLVFQNISWNLMDVWIQIIIFFWIVSAENSVENVVIFIRHYGNFLLHWFNSCHGNYSRAETIQGRNLFQGGNYSREETIRGNMVYRNIINTLTPLSFTNAFISLCKKTEVKCIQYLTS